MTVSLPATALEAEASAAGDPLQRPAVLLLGQDCVTGLQAARILAARGVPVFGLAGNPRSAFSRTRALRRVVAWSSRDSAKQLPARGELGLRPLLLPCSDEAVLWLRSHREVLASRFRFVLPRDGVLGLLADKSRFYRHALADGLAVPDTLFLDQKSDCDASANASASPASSSPRAAARRSGGRWRGRRCSWCGARRS